MRKIIILIPVFNDWDSLKKLVSEINENLKFFDEFSFECLIVNDASTIQMPEINKPNKFENMEILNMKKNKGHARCNAFGLRYIFQNKKFDYLILMDGDGEDRPVEIKSLIKMIIENPNKSVVAKRVKRSEGLFFQLLYQIHKLLTFFFTGKNINFGNYSILTNNDVGILHSKASMWSSFSGSVKKYLKDFNKIDSIRGLRYFGPSKMSLLKLIIHSFSIIAVFRNQVFFRSTLMLLALEYLNLYLENSLVILQILIVIFNLIIFIISRRELEKDLINSYNNLSEVKSITQ